MRGVSMGPRAGRDPHRSVQFASPRWRSALAAAKPVFLKSVLENLPGCATDMRLIHVTRANSTSAVPVSCRAGRSAGSQCAADGWRRFFGPRRPVRDISSSRTRPIRIGRSFVESGGPKSQYNKAIHPSCARTVPGKTGGPRSKNPLSGRTDAPRSKRPVSGKSAAPRSKSPVSGKTHAPRSKDSGTPSR